MCWLILVVTFVTTDPEREWRTSTVSIYNVLFNRFLMIVYKSNVGCGSVKNKHPISLFAYFCHYVKH